MDGKSRRETIKSVRSGESHPLPLRARGEYYLGIDVGSTSSDIVVLNRDREVAYCDYTRTKGRPIRTARCQLERLLGLANPSDIVLTSVTGSAGRLLARLLGVAFVNEVPAQAAAIHHLRPYLEGATVIEMGGQDSKLIFLSKENGSCRVRDFALNTVCAAGTGSFLDQQAQRLGIDIETEFGRLALQSKSVPRMAGRCSVFAKSDMIHLQQQATPKSDIIAGLCLALARNLKGNLGCGREFPRPMVFTGGVAANAGVVRAMEEVFELPEGGLVVPEEHFFTGAIGAVLIAQKRGDAKAVVSAGSFLERIESYLQQRGSALSSAPRREPLSGPTAPEPESRVYHELLEGAGGRVDAYLGVDVGSISTNVAVINKQRQVLAKAYLMTAGQPLEAVRRGLEIVGEKVAGKINILGAATTGSGRYLTGDFIGADVVINEITAQAAGAAIVNPDVDTIFEIGGQDSKYISLEKGVVVDFEMNHACAAGTGSFLEEQAQRLDINIDKEFAELALASKSPIKLGERCTVFMESDLLSYQQQGAETSELVAGLSYSIVANYLNRVVGRRKVGENICFQGGTAFNKAVWAAFEKVTGKAVMVPDHHEVTGAIGAAAIVAEHMGSLRKTGQQTKSSFRGFENLVTLKYSVESFGCEHCPNHCEIKKVQLPEAEPLYYGSRCDRYNVKKKSGSRKTVDAFDYRRKKLFEFAGLNGERARAHKSGATIGIPLALVNLELLPLFVRFFESIGIDVVTSGGTDKAIIRKGVESVAAQPCFPVKVAYGHVAELIERGVDYIFLPSIVSAKAEFPENHRNQLCPYVQSLPYQVRTAFADKLAGVKMLTPVIRFGDGRKLLRRSFFELGRELGVSRPAVGKALKKARACQFGFGRAMRQKGKEILDGLGADQKLFVLISRPYNGCDDGLNLQLPKKLADLGADVIPMEMLALDEAPVGDHSLHGRIYWSYGQKILRAAEIIKNDLRLFAIYLSNFSCGPDSFLLTFFKDIMSKKPCLLLELDEHSADAGVITRLEAFLDSLKHYRADGEKQIRQAKERVPIETLTPQRTLYIPYMSECSYGVAACFRAHGQPAEVMPMADEATLLRGRKYTTGKECLPCAITTGDMLKVISSGEPDKMAFFMPGSSGPCRFGMYSCMHRLVLKYAGAEGVPVIAPNQDSGFYKQFAQSVNGSNAVGIMKRMWTATAGIDLLRKVLLRLRPFAAEPDHIREVFETSLARWTEAVESQKPLSFMKSLMVSFASEFEAIELDNKVYKPRIGVVGEIYVRSHPFANMNIIARLEELGAVCDLASLSEWVYYTNFVRSRKARREGRLRNFMSNKIQDYFQHRIEKALAEPLEKRFGPLVEPPIEGVIKLAALYLHDSFEGEAVLSVGKTVEYHNHGFGGVVNVMPFSCMPSTIVSSQTMRLSADCGGMPILNLSFDGQEDATLTTRLEAFIEQVTAREKGIVNALQVRSVAYA